MTEEKKLKVVFAPEALAEMEKEFPPEELEQILAEFQELVDSGRIFEESVPINMDTLEQDDPELFHQLQAQMNAQGFDNMEDWMDATAIPPTLN